MTNGKKICEHLKVVRKQIADANGIPYEISECPHQGPCAGTCPKCESELRYIENQLSLRRAAGKAVSIVGLSLGISSAFLASGCNQPPKTESPNAPSVCNTAAEDDVDGDVLLPISENPTSADVATDESETFIIDGDIEIDPDPVPVYDSVGNLYYLSPEQMPEFPGGDTALINYIKQNLKYPALAGAIGLQGRVTLSFIVEADGTISNINVLRSPGEELSNEAIRLVKSMPKWNPGKIKDTPARVRYVLPITFRIQD